MESIQKASPNLKLRSVPRYTQECRDIFSCFQGWLAERKGLNLKLINHIGMNPTQ